MTAPNERTMEELIALARASVVLCQIAAGRAIDAIQELTRMVEAMARENVDDDSQGT